MTEPTDNELDDLMHTAIPISAHFLPVQKQKARNFARAVLAKWGTPPTVAGEPWGACVSGRVFVGGLPKHARKLAEAENLPIQWLYTAPQPTQAQAGAVPLTDEQIDAAAKKLAECMEYPWEFMPEPGRKNMRKHAQDVIDAAHGIKGGQHGADN